MKFNSKLVVLAVSLLLATGAFASDMHKGSLQTLDTLQVNGKALPAGEYKLSWQGNGPNVQLAITKNGQVIATTDAHVVELSQKPANDAAVTTTNPDGTRSLHEIRFAGKKYAFALGQNTEAQVKGSDASK